MSAVVSGLRRVLLLGAGYTAAPFVEWLTKDGTAAITIASRNLQKAWKLADPYKNTQAIELDVTSEANLSNIIPGHSLVVSSLPRHLHDIVAPLCIAHKVDMINTSYVRPALEKLDGPAKEAGVCIFTEMGLDPGIDHMLAMECIDEVHDKGGKVLSYGMFSGGLPRPEQANNPLKYKFSWTPKTVLDIGLDATTFLQDGNLVNIPEGGGAMLRTEDVDMLPGHQFECFPCGDSSLYREVYNIPEVQTLMRGHLRYKGFCSVVLALNTLGLLSEVKHPTLQENALPLKWEEFLKILLCPNGESPNDLESSVLSSLGGNEAMLKAIKGLGLMSDENVPLKSTPIDSLSSFLDNRLQYKTGESDAIFMRLNFTIDWSGTKEKRWMDWIDYGTAGGHTVMAKYVGLPEAIGASLLLDGAITEKGLIRPTIPSIYKPVLKTLREEGLKVKITSSK